MASSANQFHHLSASFGNGYFTSPKFHNGINPTIRRFYVGNHVTSYLLWLAKYNSFRAQNPVLRPNPNRALFEREGKAWDGPAELKPLPNPSVTGWIQNNSNAKHRLARRNLLYMRENQPDPKEVRRLQELEVVEMRNRRKSQRELGARMEQLAMWPQNRKEERIVRFAVQ